MIEVTACRPTEEAEVRGSDEDQYVCDYCGAIIDSLAGGQLQRLVRVVTGGPNIRSIVEDGTELHRCLVRPLTRRTSV